jgi:hypothetical protein
VFIVLGRLDKTHPTASTFKLSATQIQIPTLQGLIFSINLRRFSCCLLRWVLKQERSHVLEDGHDGKARRFYPRIDVSHPEGDC